MRPGFSYSRLNINLGMSVEDCLAGGRALESRFHT